MVLDAGVGMLLASFFGVGFDIQPSAFFITLGVLGALSPDIDFIMWTLLHKGHIHDPKVYKHRDLMHYPLIFVPLVGLVTSYFFGRFSGLLVSAGAVAHFLHDTTGLGGGIRWLWPFDNRAYYIEKTRLDGFKLYRWTEADILAREKELGAANWIRKLYQPFSLNFIAEFGVLFLGILSLLGWAAMVN